MTRRGLVTNYNDYFNDRQDSKQTTNLVRPANASVDFSDRKDNNRYLIKRHDPSFENARHGIDNQSFTNPPRQIKWPAGLHQCLNTIPIYDGHADMLPMFSQSIRNVRDAFGPEAEPWILNALSSKLKGPAAAGFAVRLTQYTSIEPLLRDLKTQYWGRESVDGLRRKLQSVEQKPDESAAAYGLKVQSLHNSIMNAYDQDPSILDSHREILKQMAIKEVRVQFLNGLRPELEAATRTARPITLAEAIDAAVAHESNRGLRNPTFNIDQSKILDQATVRLTIAETPQIDSTASDSLNNSSKIKPCDFCNRSNHATADCYALRRKIVNDHENLNRNSPSTSGYPAFRTNGPARTNNNYQTVATNSYQPRQPQFNTSGDAIIFICRTSDAMRNQWNAMVHTLFAENEIIATCNLMHAM